MKNNILVTGLTQSNYINQLYSRLKELMPDTKFFIDSTVKPPADGMSADHVIFEDYNDFKNLSFGKIFSISSLIRIPFRTICYFAVCFALLEKPGIAGLIRFVKNQIRFYFITKFVESNYNFTIFHFHFMIPTHLYMLPYLSIGRKTIITVWGSDLLRNSSRYDFVFVQNALNKVDIINVESLEMREILLAKYGRQLIDKIRFSFFPPEKKLISIIDNLISGKNDLSGIRKKLNIPGKNKIVVVGHNGFKENNHLEILKSCESLSSELTAGLHFILPLAYGLQPDYKEKLLTFQKSTRLQVVLIEEFLEWEELAELRLLTDIMIMMPVSDSQSLALIESLYSGAKCIIGKWLPYNTFRNLGLDFYEADEFDKLGNIIPKIASIKLSDEVLNRRREIIKGYFFDEVKVLKPWIDIFNELTLGKNYTQPDT